MCRYSTVDRVRIPVHLPASCDRLLPTGGLGEHIDIAAGGLGNRQIDFLDGHGEEYELQLQVWVGGRCPD